ncbi:Gfo/Idh/MocA family oxidoreductase [Pseudoflavitalea sp. G-6-1-2]|uniref:Gfo/Idh/MocA family protein n=1 Tax=Pseudoflavitalea sp. G-6-1-2 TaxID=2728841 RepID=UPI00146A5DEF|nr:Gfo/Idh/MocA family oxidoreductase [Pseudoflavitalea sp. G-6-1-2]NML19607.1 Gfo/Idh/MocA family oxidoreductase [Pseudoflavitalea sp. G-6-1-2]
MKKLNFAIIGCGRIAQRHAEHINNTGKLVAVCDVDKAAADALAAKYGVTAYTDAGEMLAKEKSIDVVSICSPNGLHTEHTLLALKAGTHVLCEKPMALSVSDAGRMIDAAEKANRRLFIVKQNRFNPPVMEVKKIIDEGKLGKIFSVQLNCFWNRNDQYYSTSAWKGTKKLDGGTLFTQFSHFIDLLYWLIGDVKNAHSFISNKAHDNVIEFEDCGVATVEFHNGVIGTINYTVNSFGKNMEGSLTIFGEKGTVKIGGQYLNELEYQNIEGHKIENLPPGNPPNNYGQYVGSMSNHDQVYQNIHEVLNNNGIIATNGYEGMKTVEIIDKIYSNARNI